MLRRNLLWFGLILVSTSACAASAPRVDPLVASEVEVNKNDPPWGCGFLGPVKGNTALGELSDAHGDMIRNAVLSGGNYVAVDLIEKPTVAGLGGYTIRGRLFICPKHLPPASQPTTAFHAPGPMIEEVAAPRSAKSSDDIILPKAICEPDCSPGFTCLHAMCVSACNPACGKGEKCGADRACHAAP